MDFSLSLDKLALDLIHNKPSNGNKSNKIYVVLVATGSFNPPTFMHLRMFELARDALSSDGFCVIGGYMSPVNDAYKKKSLISAEHRIRLCHLACKSSDFVMVDPWEASQSTYQRTLTVLSRVHDSVCMTGFVSRESLKVMLLCGSDLLHSFGIPGFWICDQENGRRLILEREEKGCYEYHRASLKKHRKFYLTSSFHNASPTNKDSNLLNLVIHFSGVGDEDWLWFAPFFICHLGKIWIMPDEEMQ